MGNKNRSNNKAKDAGVNHVTNVVNIDYDKLADAIVRAHSRIEEEKSKAHNRDWAEWRLEIGLKDYPKHPIRQFFNSFSSVIRAIFISRSKVRTKRTTYILIQMATEGTFSVLKLLLYVLTTLFGIQAYCYGIEYKWLPMFTSAGMCLSAFMFARLLRLAGFEISNMKDREEILTISSSVASIAAVVLAIVAIILQVVIK